MGYGRDQQGKQRSSFPLYFQQGRKQGLDIEPLRFLIYAGMIYSKYVENKANRINIYRTKQQMLPIPKLICFYNGTAEAPDRSELHLASAFPEGSDSDIAVKVTMLNINYGRNKALLDACQPLRDYSWLVAI